VLMDGPGLSRDNHARQRRRTWLTCPHPNSNGDTREGPDRGSTISAPRWVKVVGGIVVVLVLLIGITMLGGSHGPGAHAPLTGRRHRSHNCPETWVTVIGVV
jgi:hypothetical protein